ncbi:protein disulfide-isomerase precursor [Ascosphaera acerosa]|nr:protein disulfide-isomerase precursor [Ascosphaera acerosa]
MTSLYSLSPKYDDLGKLYKDNGFGDKVTIAKIDATANDVPEDIAGFPTIKLYPAGAKSEPVDFQDQRDVETLANFVRDHGKHGVDAWAAGLKKQEEDAKEEKEAEKKEKAEEKEEKEAEKKEKAAEKEEKEAEKSEAKEGEETASAAEAAEKPTPTGSADSAEPTSMTPVSGEQKEEATEAPAHEEL